VWKRLRWGVVAGVMTVGLATGGVLVLAYVAATIAILTIGGLLVHSAVQRWQERGSARLESHARSIREFDADPPWAA
jgi:hypothetical protein